jgi:hypothetical protein
VTAQLACPYHPAAADHRPLFEAGEDAGLTSMSCGLPVVACPNPDCGAPNRVVARFCRVCGWRIARDAGEAALNAMLAALWRTTHDDAGPEPVQVPLPAGVGAVTALLHAFGLVFVGTRRGRVLVFNAWSMTEVVASLSLGEPVLGLGAFAGGAEPACPGPCILVFTRSGAFRIPAWPEFVLEQLWAAQEGWRMATPGVPLSRGLLLFQRQAEHAQVVWSAWAEPPEAARTLREWIGPDLAPPVAAGPGRAFFADADRAFLFDEVDPESLRAAPLPSRPDPIVSPSFQPELGEVFLVYEEDRLRGVARVSVPGLEWLRVVDPVFTSLQMAAVDEKALVLATHDDLEIVSPVAGQRRWSLKRDLHVDRLSLSQFAPVRAGGYLLLYADARQGGQAVYLLPLSATGLREGPRRVAQTGRLEMPPLAVPAGVVCVPQGTDPANPEMLVVKPTSR